MGIVTSAFEENFRIASRQRCGRCRAYSEEIAAAAIEAGRFADGPTGQCLTVPRLSVRIIKGMATTIA